MEDNLIGLIPVFLEQSGFPRLLEAVRESKEWETIANMIEASRELSEVNGMEEQAMAILSDVRARLVARYSKPHA